MKGWNSRRSSTLSTRGMCSSSQPLATSAGVKILEAGGSAADAAVAMAAVLNVCEPCSTGIGGDAFALYFEASSKKVSCFMGNGAVSRNLSLDFLKSKGFGTGEGLIGLPKHSGLCVSVPGAAACWDDLVRQHGKLPLLDVLMPAITFAENGVPIHECAAEQWAKSTLQGEEAHSVFNCFDGQGPKAGDVFRNPKLAETFRSLGKHGAADGFYSGRIAAAIIAAVMEFDGVLDLDDLSSHQTEIALPVFADYKGYRIYETPPPTHGIAALQALQMIEHLDLQDGQTQYSRGCPNNVHREVECMRLAYADALSFVCDPRFGSSYQAALLNPVYAKLRSSLVGESAAEVQCGDLSPFLHSDTVYFCCVDKDGNACSMINSNYMGFGTGISPRDCGFTLQNRGYNASLDPLHPNHLYPRKRPYHTIIPGMITVAATGDFFATFGNMGGFMQPMGHFQIVRNLIDYRMTPQQAVDAPRWFIKGVGSTQSDAELRQSNLQLEFGYGGQHDGGAEKDDGEAMTSELRQRGHEVGPLVTDEARTLYGRAQIIKRDPITGVLWGGSDPRADGCAMAAI